MTAIIQAKQLKKSFKSREVVSGVDFTITGGQCFGFLGPNGAGKTTILKMILGLSPPDSGSLTVFDSDIRTAAAQLRHRIGVVPQLDNLDPDFTVEENLVIYGSYFRLSMEILQPRIEKLLQFVGLADRAKSRITTLSGGMQRRLSIARALINDPDLIVLDEPTTGLDPQARHAIWGRLRDLIQSGKTLILTTHYMEEAERLCNELVIMESGRIIVQGSPKDLIIEHVEPEVVEIRSSLNPALAQLKGMEDCRAETVGDMAYCYTANGKALIEKIEGLPELVFLHRPANLEDVFLKLTGRELRD